MIINGIRLLENTPIKHMYDYKEKYRGTSFGLSEAGYDIRIAENVHFKRGFFYRRSVRVSTDGLGADKVNKGNFVLASSIEKFQMPKNMVARVCHKSTWARKGLDVFSGTVIEPGWNGYLTLELVYHGNEKDFYIYAGQGIAQIIFEEISSLADYGNGKYQNQKSGAQKAR